LDDDQKETAEDIVTGIKAAVGGNVQCDVEKATRFYRAEEYHQDYLSQRVSGRW
jgi:peptide methionine sulfoxide reductase MsrA